MNNCLCEELQKFFDSFPQTHHKVGEVIIWPSENPQGVFLLEAGFIRSYLYSKEGDEYSAHIYTNGSIFPMSWAINDFTNQLYYEAMSDVSVRIVPRDKFIEFVKENSEVSFCLMKKFSAQTVEMTRQLEILSSGNAEARLVSVLIYFAYVFSCESKNEVIIKHHFTHEEISSFARISRERTTIELNNLIKKNLITIEDHLIHIPSLPKLQQELANNMK